MERRILGGMMKALRGGAAAAFAFVITVSIHAQIPTGVTFEKLGAVTFIEPTFIGPVPTDPNQIIVIERVGKIYRMVNAAGNWTRTPWFSVDANVNTHWDGCWNVEFHPKFSQNHLFYVLYRTKTGDTHSVLEEWTCGADLSNPHKVRDVITFDQNHTSSDGGIHSSGDVHFGPDGLLYTSQGDRHVLDAQGRDVGSQNMNETWGKVDRIDVDNKDANLQYAIPADNPFKGQAGYRPEAWAVGFRMPYRFSFDRLTGDLMVGDVGDLTYEEINLAQAGKNYGAGKLDASGKVIEGMCTSNCTGVTNPILQLPHGCVIGGVTYRNDPTSQFYGVYIFADYGHSQLLGLKMNPAKNGVTEQKTLATTPGKVSALGVDAVGNIYVTTYSENAAPTLLYKLKHAELRPAASIIQPFGSRPMEAVSALDLKSARYRVYALDGRLQAGNAVKDVMIVRDAKTGETRKWVRLP